MTTTTTTPTGTTPSAPATHVEAALYLLPSTMSDAPAGNVLPALNFEIIKGIRHFVVENVRTARRFLKRCDPSIDISALTFVTLDEHTDPAEVPAMLSPLAEGHPVGVISEAGCPAVADPGADLVAVAQQKGMKVIPLVGPSSILMALMGSGFNGQSFTFNGYLPHDSRQRADKLREMERLIRTRRQTQIFIETPYRNNRLIAELCTSLPSGLRLCVASDITGPSQEIVTLPLARWAKRTYNYDKVPTIFLLYS